MSEETARTDVDLSQADAVVDKPPRVEPEPETSGEVVYCPQCGAQMLESDRYCTGCGWDAEHPDDPPLQAGKPRREPPVTPRRIGPPSDYNRLTTFLLCLLLGFFGVHRFYVGRMGSGVLWLLTGGILAVGWIYDLVMIATGEFQDEHGKRIVYWQ